MPNFLLTTDSIGITVDDLKDAMMEYGDQLIIDIEDFIAEKTSDGMGEKAIKESLLSMFDPDSGSMFGAFSNYFASKIGVMMDTLSDAEKERVLWQSGEDADQVEEVWVATMVNTCPDCLALHGRVKTHEEWVEEGEPNVRPTVCTIKGYCHCNLIPTGQLQADDIKDIENPIKLRREKIQKYAEMRARDGVILSKAYKDQLLGQANNPDSMPSGRVRVNA